VAHGVALLLLCKLRCVKTVLLLLVCANNLS